MARPLVSVSAVRVSLTVRTKQAIEAGPWARWSMWLTLGFGIRDLGFLGFDHIPAGTARAKHSLIFRGSPSVSITTVAVAEAPRNRVEADLQAGLTTAVP